ncbi:S16 family serine protease [Paenibacillus kobensis]|uniref:S16 family serine protease n=1 Tax=Paenibacillus kobensis TaxID=59841 RepID=UPI000FDBA319|nr:PDZ domain-containing protein [Paenibacillus kobensis]
MRSALKMYWTGIALAFLYIAAAELIWVPDPLRLPGGLTWLETIDRLLYAPALIALIWIAGAAAAWQGEDQQGRRLLRKIPRVFVIGSGIAAMIAIIAAPRTVTVGIGLLVVNWLFVLIDLFVIELSDRNRRRRWPMRTVTALAAQLALLAVMALPISYNVTYPGLTMNMNHYARVEGGNVNGQLTGVLVFDRRAVPLDWLMSRVLNIYELSPVPPNEPPLREAYAEVVAMKTEAETVATAVALGKLGLSRGAEANGVNVNAIAEQAAARGILKAGDRIVSIADHPTLDVQSLTEAMSDVKPGSIIVVGLVRGSDSLSLAVPTGSAEDDNGKERAVFGVSVETAYHYDIPRQVKFERPFAHIGGPSHGAMLALTIIDQLTPDGISHGRKIAGTGTIEPDGSVGPVGGVRQKAYAVARTDAELFFVPASEESEARAGLESGDTLEIVPVQTLDEMLQWLKDHAKS